MHLLKCNINRKTAKCKTNNAQACPRLNDDMASKPKTNSAETRSELCGRKDACKGGNHQSDQDTRNIHSVSTGRDHNMTHNHIHNSLQNIPNSNAVVNINANKKNTNTNTTNNIIVQQDDNSYTTQSSDAEYNYQNEYASPNLRNDGDAANEIYNSYSRTDDTSHTNGLNYMYSNDRTDNVMQPSGSCNGDGGAQLADKRKQTWTDAGNVCKKVRTISASRFVGPGSCQVEVATEPADSSNQIEVRTLASNLKQVSKD